MADTANRVEAKRNPNTMYIGKCQHGVVVAGTITLDRPASDIIQDLREFSDGGLLLEVTTNRAAGRLRPCSKCEDIRKANETIISALNNTEQKGAGTNG